MILHVESLSLTQTQNFVSRGLISLYYSPVCHSHTPQQRCLSLLRYENLRLFLLNISFSHTNTNSVSQGLIFLHRSFVCRSHTLSLPRDILRSLICFSSYHSRFEISFSLADTKLISRDVLSLRYLFVCESHAPFLHLSHTHTHNSAF